MENKNTFGATNSFNHTKGHFMANNLDDGELSFEDSFRAYPKTSMNCFGYFEDRSKFDNPLGLEFSHKPNNLHERPTFNFDQNPFKEDEETPRGLFNFFQLDSPVDQARSFEKELTEDLDFSYSHLYFSADLKTIQDKQEQKQGKAAEEREFPILETNEVPKEIPAQNVVSSSAKVDDKKSSYSSVEQSAVDPENLSKLLKCLSKSKGVNQDQLTENIVARTVEFGQKKVAEDLNIPYRRYKSILNKCGIKTAAGRKVNNLQLESELVEWALKIKDAGLVLTRKMIREKASEFSNELAKDGEGSTKKVSLSKGWLDKFVKRHEEIKDYLTSQKGKKGL